MTEAAILEDFFANEEQKTDKLIELPKDFWVHEQLTAEEDREILTPEITLIDLLEENEDLDREKQIDEELNGIREEVEETCAEIDNVFPVPELAFDETSSLLEQMSHDIPLPDIMWLEDGGIGLEWRPGDSIVTMSLYGDNHVNFVAIVEKNHKIAGTCPLSDSPLLPGFLATLTILF